MASTKPQHPPFSYQPLDHDSKQIRLLRFRGDQQMLGDDDSLMKFEIVTVSLESDPPPSYYAISYAWGVDPGPGRILLNNCEAAVPSSAEQALRGVLRGLQQCGLNSSPAIWIDAICIQQVDLEEKSQQVAMMRNIYATAAGALIWLGNDHDGSTPRALETMRLLDEDRTSTGLDEDELQQKPLTNSWYNDTNLPYRSNPTPQGCDWKAFDSVLSSRWFSRLWVVQELANARDVKCFRGANVIHWKTLAHAVHWVSHRKFEESMSAMPEFEAKLTMINNMVQLRDKPNEHDDLEELLALNFHFNASNPWDRVYALLGVWNSLKPGGFPEQNVEGITVDYNRALKDVYAQATFTAMVRSGQLALMSFVSMDAQTDDEGQWPSWVPRWNRAAGLAQAGYTEACFNLMSRSIAGPQEVCHYSKEGNVLRVRGLPVGNIAFALDLTPMAALHRQGSPIDTVFDSLCRAWSKRSNPKEKLDHIARSLQPLKGTKFRLGTANWYVRDFAALFLQVIEQFTPSWPRYPELRQQFALAGGDEGDATGLTNALSGFADSLGSLSFAQLENGSFGFCVGDVEEGDEVLGLFRSDCLFVARKKDGYHRICAFICLPRFDDEHRQIFRDRDRLKESARTFSII